MNPRAALLASAALSLLLSCRSELPIPDLGGLYNAAARAEVPDRNPVIVIPGILGSRLVEDATGRIVWGAFTRGYADPSTGDGARLFAHPMGLDVPLSELRDGVRADGALDRLEVSLFGLPIVQAAYLQILTALGVGGYVDESLGLAGTVDYGDEHFTCFQFDYDWRRDLSENAERFHAFLLERRAYVAEEMRVRFGIEDAAVRFDVVAHSMGGLLLRYYLRHGDRDLGDEGPLPPLDWAGAEHIERAVLVATPNAGSASSFQQLVHGVKYAFFLPRYGAALIGTLPSAYQLLPRERHGFLRVRDDPSRSLEGIYSVDTWEKNQWGLLDPRQEDWLETLLPGVERPEARRAIARDHLRKCLVRADRLHRSLDRAATPPEGLELFLVAGDAVATLADLQVDDEGYVYAGSHGAGDGTVLRSSALLDERVNGAWTPRVRTPIAWRQVLFLFSDHLGLTRDPVFTDNVLYLLLEDPTRPSGMHELR